MSSRRPSRSLSPKRAEARLLTVHARVLLLIAADPGVRLDELADRAGIHRRHLLRVLVRLEATGHIARKGSTSLSATYEVHRESTVHEPPIEMTVGQFLAALAGTSP